jgi:RimJ/RimL family protein N-acetyltransferase
MEGDIAGTFLSGYGEVIFRYPRFEDWKGMLDAINSLVEEKAYIARQEKKTDKEQQETMRAILYDIERKEMVGLVAEFSDELIGWVAIGKIAKEKESGGGVLGFIFLIPEFRGLGIARNLLSVAIVQAQNVLEIKKISVETCAPNEAAIKLYNECGFVKTDKEPGFRDHYGQTVERIEMAKELLPDRP